MQIIVKIGAANPDSIDLEAVAAELPYGKVKVEPEKGGLDIPAENGKDLMVIVNAAVLVCFAE